MVNSSALSNTHTHIEKNSFHFMVVLKFQKCLSSPMIYNVLTYLVILTNPPGMGKNGHKLLKRIYLIRMTISLCITILKLAIIIIIIIVIIIKWGFCFYTNEICKMFYTKKQPKSWKSVSKSIFKSPREIQG